MRRPAPQEWTERQLATLAACVLSGRGGSLAALAEAVGVSIAAVREQLSMLGVRLAAVGMCAVEDGDIVRELFGVQQQMRAHGAAFVTTSRYTTDARAFASDVAMWLIDGEELLGIIRAGLDGTPLAVRAPTATAEPTCPACGGAW